jgi:hypothetical protein
MSSQSTVAGQTTTDNGSKLSRLKLIDRIKSFTGVIIVVWTLLYWSPLLLVCIIVCKATGSLFSVRTFI